MANVILTEEQYQALLKMFEELERRKEAAEAKAKEKKAA
jgi:hypothetical protein